MQELLRIGITEKDFQLLDKALRQVSEANTQTQKLEFEVEIPSGMNGFQSFVGSMFASKIKGEFGRRKALAIQENEELVELQYRLLQLKKLLAQYPGDMPG